MALTIEEILANHSDSDILEIYNSLFERGSSTEAEVLRARFIRMKGLSDGAIKWTPALIELVLSENIQLMKDSLDDERLRKLLNCEFDNEVLAVSRLNTFMMVDLYKSEQDINLKRKLELTRSVEMNCLTKSLYKQCVIEFLMNVYLGNEDKPERTIHSLNRALLHLEAVYSPIKGLNDDLYFEKEVDISYYDHQISEDMKRYQTVPYSEDTNLRYLRLSLAVMFGYYMYRGNKTNAEYFLIKALGLLNKGDFLYDILTFLEKKM